MIKEKLYSQSAKFFFNQRINNKRIDNLPDYLNIKNINDAYKIQDELKYINETETLLLKKGNSLIKTSSVDGCKELISKGYETTNNISFGVQLIANTSITLSMHYPEGSAGEIDSTKVKIYF